MFRKWTVLLNIGIVLALVLAVFPFQGALASTRSDGGFKLIFPKTGEACEKYAKANVTGKVAGATVEYTFYSWATGAPIVIGTATAPLGTGVKFEYPGGIGNGRYSVVAVVYDAAGNRIWKKGAKWTIECLKTPRG